MIKVFVIILLLVSSVVMAHNKVVVIPMGGDLPLQNVITVAKNNGNFTDPVKAMESITNANEDNRYLLVIGPGVYNLTETLVMREYVDILGSGRNTTRLTGAISSSAVDPSSAIVHGADNAGIHSLSIANNGRGTNCLGIFNGSSSLTMSDINITVTGGLNGYGVYNFTATASTMSDMKITASGAGDKFGVYNYNSSSITMSDIIIAVSGSVDGYGIFNFHSSPIMSELYITVSGETFSYGIYNSSASPIMSALHIEVSGGTGNAGVWNYSSSPTMSDIIIETSGGGGSESGGIINDLSSSTMSDMRITVTGGAITYGVGNRDSSSSAHIRNSFISAGTNSVIADTGSGANETYIFHSVLSSGVSGDPICSYTSTVAGVALNANCLP